MNILFIVQIYQTKIAYAISLLKTLCKVNISYNMIIKQIVEF